jgi:hypothetical protein
MLLHSMDYFVSPLPRQILRGENGPADQFSYKFGPPDQTFRRTKTLMTSHHFLFMYLLCQCWSKHEGQLVSVLYFTFHSYKPQHIFLHSTGVARLLKIVYNCIQIVAYLNKSFNGFFIRISHNSSQNPGVLLLNTWNVESKQFQF